MDASTIGPRFDSRHPRGHGELRGEYCPHVRGCNSLGELTRQLLSRSNTQDNLNAGQVANFPSPTFEVERQRAIADVFGAEVAIIDALIVKKRRLIELLEDR